MKTHDKEKQGDPPPWQPTQTQTCPREKKHFKTKLKHAMVTD